MNFSHDFAQDCIDLLESTAEGEPVALSRFCDGEYALLQHTPVLTADGWFVPKEETPFTAALRDSLKYQGTNYHVGISPPCCLPEQFEWYQAEAGVPESRRTFANVFVDGNHQRIVDWVKRRNVFETCALVACTGGAYAKPMNDYTVPANAVNEPWDIDGLVAALRKETRPILVAAGPAAAIIIHRYWKSQPQHARVTILDVGSIFDAALHGTATRGYLEGDHPNRRKVCSWTNCDIHSMPSPY